MAGWQRIGERIYHSYISITFYTFTILFHYIIIHIAKCVRPATHLGKGHMWLWCVAAHCSWPGVARHNSIPTSTPVLNYCTQPTDYQICYQWKPQRKLPEKNDRKNWQIKLSRSSSWLARLPNKRDAPLQYHGRAIQPYAHLRTSSVRCSERPPGCTNARMCSQPQIIVFFVRLVLI